MVSVYLDIRGILILGEGSERTMRRKDVNEG